MAAVSISWATAHFDKLPLLSSFTSCACERQAERKLLPLDWRRRLQLIQHKVSAASQQGSADAAFQRGHSADYLAVAALRDRLAESAARSLLGGLTGPAADWDKLVRAYEAKSKLLSLANNTFACLA